eukprot:CAMPEP_0119499852 /NCGR_PEP_ID=MMETSP1344-20130328/22178_1 /TAXON_ID=236787 /ORGANISM="Florenciella parvula, Strain CCMP2471" /LENGTH=111 /DNA_ID=CAMNT_0007535887 /DNA_START=28 /DNA_END=363 /DNA_ORIENTATION=+
MARLACHTLQTRVFVVPRSVCLGGRLGGRRGFGLCAVDLNEHILEEVDVNELGPPPRRVHAPQEEGHLERVIERDPVEQRMNKDLKQREHCIHAPVREPELVIVATLRLDG